MQYFPYAQNSTMILIYLIDGKKEIDINYNNRLNIGNWKNEFEYFQKLNGILIPALLPFKNVRIIAIRNFVNL